VPFALLRWRVDWPAKSRTAVGAIDLLCGPGACLLVLSGAAVGCPVEAILFSSVLGGTPGGWPFAAVVAASPLAFRCLDQLALCRADALPPVGEYAAILL